MIFSLSPPRGTTTTTTDAEKQNVSEEGDGEETFGARGFRLELGSPVSLQGGRCAVHALCG